MIEALRRRFGLILLHIDRAPAFGALVAAMDAEAVSWARAAATHAALAAATVATASSSSSSGGGGGGGGGGSSTGAGKSALPVRSALKGATSSAPVAAGTHSSSGGGNSKGGKGGAGAGAGRSNPLSPSPAEELSGLCAQLGISLPSTRHLVLWVQSSLLAVPLALRQARTNIPAEMRSGLAAPSSRPGPASAATSWFERRTQCDALLSLCKSLLQFIGS
jgi:hypothetical protein